jgi:sec-independent protein translocase protein TatA
LAIIPILIIIIFGLGRLPEVGGALGRGMREFRKSQSEVEKLTQPVEAEKPEEK